MCKKIKTGINNIDEKIDISSAKLIILASRPAMGKSTLALKILSNIAKKQNKKVLYINLETTIKAELLNNKNIHIEDKGEITIDEICKKAKELKPQIIVIDYLQLIEFKKGCLSRDIEIQEILKKLKQLTQELNIPILVLSQLSRAPEKRKNHRPVLTDFSESKIGIDKYADIVLFLYRDEYYNKNTSNKNIVEIIIAKNQLQTETIEIQWNIN